VTQSVPVAFTTLHPPSQGHNNQHPGGDTVQARVFTVSSVFITEVYLVISMYHYSFFSAVVLAAAVFEQTTTTSYFSF